MQHNKTQLKKIFRDAHEIFTQRVKQLGNLKHALSASNEEALGIMLSALIQARMAIDALRSEEE